MTGEVYAEAGLAVGFSDNPLRRAKKMLVDLDELLLRFNELDYGLKALKKALGNGEIAWTPPRERTK